MWYVIVFFMATANPTESQPLFVFTNPSFSSEALCRGTLTHKPSIMMYTQKLMQVYNGELPGKIRGVNCINEEMKQELDAINRNETLGTSIWNLL